MKRSWWKVPLYCILASWICFHLEVYLVARWAVITRPDGSVSSDTTRSLIISGILFAVIAAIGGLLFFRKMTRKEIFLSASCLVLFNVTVRLLSYHMHYWIQWDSFISRLLYLLHVNTWVSEAVVWLLAPYIFVLFGKKSGG